MSVDQTIFRKSRKFYFGNVEQIYEFTFNLFLIVYLVIWKKIWVGFLSSKNRFSKKFLKFLRLT